MNMNLNFSTPFFLFLSDDNQKGISSKIESYVGTKAERILVIGTKKEKMQSIGRYFEAAFFVLIHSEVTLCSMKMFMAKMLEIAFNSQNTPQSPQAIMFPVITFEWFNNIPINLTKVYALYNLSVPHDTLLQDDEKDEKCSLALLNAFSQVLLSSNCSLADHIEWTTIFGISFFNHFLNLCQEVTEKTTFECLKDLLPASRNSAQSTPRIPQLGQPYRRQPRIRVPEKARIFMEEFLDKKVGQITQNEVISIAAMFEMTETQVRVFFKNRKARLRKVPSALMAGYKESFDSQPFHFYNSEAPQQMDQNTWTSYYQHSEAGVQNWGYSPNWEVPNPYPQDAFNSIQQYPFNYEGIYGEMTPVDSYQMPTMETSPQYYHHSLDTAAPDAPNPFPSESKPETKSIATMLSPLNLTPAPPTPRLKRLSKQEKEVLKTFILPEDYHKKLHLAKKDIKERLEKSGQFDFLDHQILNLFRTMKREAARPKPHGSK